MHEAMAELRLKRGEEKRLRAGHLWVFSNEVDTERTPIKELTPGQGVIISEHNGKPIGCGYANPHSLICARLVSRSTDKPLDTSLIVHRLKVALSLRQRLFAHPHYRLIHGEGDGLPGLVVDRFDDICVIQINTAGMEAARAAVIDALNKVLKPAHILVRADSGMRALEGLETYVEWAGETGPDELSVEENGARFKAPSLAGQKTGWYYDHRANRLRLAPYVKDARVLDLFSYAGAWGVQAALAGAREVVCVDSSEQALGYAQANAQRNDVGDRFSTLKGDVFQVLKGLREQRERFDVVIADPPAFIKKRKDYRAGLSAYHQLNQLAIQVLSKDGLLVSASCSAHLSEKDLLRTVLSSARHLDRTAQIIEFGGQGQDHPVHPAIPETRYLKALFARILPASGNP